MNRFVLLCLGWNWIPDKGPQMFLDKPVTGPPETRPAALTDEDPAGRPMQNFCSCLFSLNALLSLLHGGEAVNTLLSAPSQADLVLRWRGGLRRNRASGEHLAGLSLSWISISNSTGCTHPNIFCQQGINHLPVESKAWGANLLFRLKDTSPISCPLLPTADEKVCFRYFKKKRNWHKCWKGWIQTISATKIGLTEI